jgi:hypothetical protein
MLEQSGAAVAVHVERLLVDHLSEWAPVQVLDVGFLEERQKAHDDVDSPLPRGSLERLAGGPKAE